MTNHEMFTIVQNQLSINLNCTVADINGEKDSFVFVEANEKPGRMPYQREKQHFDIMTMGKSIIVSATPARLKYAKEQLIGKSRDEAFSMPFLCSHSMWYLPDLDNLKHISAPNGFLYETVEKKEIPKLYDLKGFSYAIQYTYPGYSRNTCQTRECYRCNGRSVGTLLKNVGDWGRCTTRIL